MSFPATGCVSPRPALSSRATSSACLRELAAPGGTVWSRYNLAEILSEPLQFRELVSLRRQPPGGGALPEIYGHVERLFRASAPLDRYVGWYYRYFYSFGRPGRITRSLASIARVDGRFLWKNVERARLREGEPWQGYRQFCLLFLNPLLLQAYTGARSAPASPCKRRPRRSGRRGSRSPASSGRPDIWNRGHPTMTLDTGLRIFLPLYIVASTEPSTTNVSQSVISTPLSLMFGPTVSLLSPSLAGAVFAAGAVGAAGLRRRRLVAGRCGSRGSGGRSGDRPRGVPPAAGGECGQ